MAHINGFYVETHVYTQDTPVTQRHTFFTSPRPHTPPISDDSSSPFRLILCRFHMCEGSSYDSYLEVISLSHTQFISSPR